MSWKVQPQMLEEFNKHLYSLYHPFQAAERRNEELRDTTSNYYRSMV